MTFTTASDEIQACIRVDNNGSSGGSFRITRLKLEEGAVATPWSPSADLVTGTTSINENGITVAHSNVGTKTIINADGFRIVNNLGEEIGSLASVSGLTVLNADRVTANNILTVDNVDRALYVNGNTGDDLASGTSSSSSFKTVKKALDTLKEYGAIRQAGKTAVVYIYGVINEDIFIRNFIGGVVEFRFDRLAEVNGKIGIEYCNAQINLYGGRTMSTDSGGCLITCKDTNATVINVYYSSTVFINGFRITSKGGNGVSFTGSLGYVTWCDINYCNATSMSCIRARYNSNVAVHDCTGSNNGIALYAEYGGVITIGQQSNGASVTCPNCNTTSYGVYGGYVYSLGTITKLNSAYAPAIATTQVYTTTWDTTSTGSWRDSGYGWRTDNSYIYQGSYGYGNHRGFMIFSADNIRTALSGAILHNIQLRLIRNSSGGSSASQNIHLWGHSYTATGGGYELAKDYGIIGSWSWGEDKWVSIPIQVATDLKAGFIQGLAIYDSSGSPYVTCSATAQLYIKYEK